jgi:HK97 family phage major capsid protein
VGADDLFTTYYNLDFKYRPNATWVMPDTMAKLVRTLKDSQNRYLLADNINNMLSLPQSTILGRPVQIHTGMATPAANSIGIVFGDFYYFVIADRTGIVIIFADQLRRATGQVSWFLRKRFDCHMLNTSAFTMLKMSAT